MRVIQIGIGGLSAATSLLALPLGARAVPSEASTPVHKPPMAFSNESNYHQLRLANLQGDAADHAAEWVVRQAAPASGEMAAGQYRVAFTITPPEGWYATRQGGELAWHAPDPNAVHLRVLVRDGSDRRVVPGLTVRATLLDASSGAAVVPTTPLPYGWYPAINGYGENVTLPAHAGAYRLRVEIDPPDYWRHDPYNGDRYTKPTVAVFDRVSLDPAAFAGKPPASETDTDQQVALAKAMGDAFTTTQAEMTEKQATDAKQTVVGDYRVVCAIEYSEGYWYYHGKHFQYNIENEMGAENNCHVEVVVRDLKTGRFLPDLTMSAQIVTGDGKDLGTQPEHFMWHPWMFHYGNNRRVPRSGHYRIQVHFDAPSWRRYGHGAENLFAKSADVTFDNVLIKTGER